MALDADGVKFMQNMVDFASLKDKSDQEVTDWAIEKWGEFKSSPYWDSPDAIPFTSIFIRYMGRYIPELANTTRESLQVNTISETA